MPRADLDAQFTRIDALVNEIQQLVPENNYQNVQFRADLAGLLVVAIAATYESCVKETLFAHANSHHAAFGGFTRRNYERLNSRIRLDDLSGYCTLFDPAIKVRFKDRLRTRKTKLLERVGKNIEVSYGQILAWRNDFAHAGIRNTTIEEAAQTHRIGKRVLYVFDDAFCRP